MSLTGVYFDKRRLLTFAAPRGDIIDSFREADIEGMTTVALILLQPIIVLLSE